ncbi:uncharacterized protein LOC115728823 [Rhodamnia argentea]|uniref:Uncharacterized protein LOC115728823 n=1 Tax=Rhodamnia argentea TaxID=178133 RepID=A0A8B8MY99_9MYRT|nr:uncharacterized protein LOC115728823 [Rhodamnia argentea]
MSCLSLRLPPPKKAWKILTSKLQRKLPKLRRPRPVYKLPKTQVLAAAPSGAEESVFVVKQPGRQHRQRPRRVHSSVVFNVRRHVFKKQQAHVFVDKLFKEPLEGIIEHHCLDTLPVKYMPSPKSLAAIDRSALEAGMSDGDHDGSDAKTCEADDMWESVGLASPLTHRIDERAEEFISKFRAEMERQEMVARSL